MNEIQLESAFNLCKEKRLADLIALIETYDVLETSDEWGETILTTAIKSASRYFDPYPVDNEVVNYILSLGPANINNKTKSGMTALLFALMKKNFEAIENLVNNEAVLENDKKSEEYIKECYKESKKNGWPVLSDNIIEKLLKSGTSFSTIASAICFSDNQNYIPKLLKLNIPISNDLATIGGGSSFQYFLSSKPSISDLYLALCIASQGNIERVMELINAGADPNGSKIQGIIDTPLNIALRNGEELIVKHLLLSRANVNLQDSNGNTPLLIALRNPCKVIEDVRSINYTSMEKLADWPIGFPGLYIEQGIYKTVKKSSIRIIQDLVEKGANVNLSNNKGITPLSLAIDKHDYDAMKYLLHMGSNPNHIEKKGNFIKNDPKNPLKYGITPLMRALVTNEPIKYVQLLLEFGADKNVNNLKIEKIISDIIKYTENTNSISRVRKILSV